MVKRVVSLAFVKTSGSGLPLPSVSDGTAAGKFEPRRRTYCEAATAGMVNDIVRNVLPSTNEVTGVQPPLLKVFSSAVEVFLAADGTAASVAVVPSAWSQLVLRGHSPA